MNIRSFVGGLFVGAALVAGASVLADDEPVKVSKSGKLHHYEVLNGEGKRVCEDPFIYVETKTIRCE